MADDATPHAPAETRPKRFTWDEVIAMSRADIFAETERVELEDGELYIMPEEGPLHVDALEALKRWIDAHLPSFAVSVRGPLHLGDGSVYIPDLVVFPVGFRARDMVAANAKLVIEVSDTTLNRDKRRKVPRLAAVGVVEFWIVHPLTRTIIVHRDPGDGWGSIATFGMGRTVAPICAPHVAFAVADLPDPEA